MAPSWLSGPKTSILGLFLFGLCLLAQAQDRRAAILATLDSLIPAKMQELHIPGVAISIVKDSQVWLAKGYGLADLESERPVDGPTTGFRVASLSKLFTATAVLQLAAAGQLDLHADIRSYLTDIDLQLRYPQPVTLHHLLTHTAGFDLSDIGDATADTAKIYSLRELVANHQQPQVLPPGFAYHYSNFGFALAGYIVEKVSGAPFPDYVQRHIFQPLGMEHSTFAQPQPDTIISRLSRSYEWQKGAYVPLPLDYSQVAPADALISTASDMARFMLGQLGTGGSLLDRKSRILLHSQQFTANPSAYGMAYAFHEGIFGNVRVIDHSGGQLGFASYLVLVPGLNLGVFLSQNRREGDLRWTVVRTIMESLLPPFSYPEEPLAPVDSIETTSYAGVYRYTGYNRSTFEKMAYLVGLAGREIQVQPDGPGAILVDGERFVRNADGQFVDARQGFRTRAFLRDEQGRITYHAAGRDLFERPAWWERKEMLQGVLLTSFFLALWHATLWPWLVRRRIRRHQLTSSRDNRRWRRLVYAASGLWFTTFIFLYAVTVLMSKRPVQFDYGVTWEMKIALILLHIAVLCVLAVPLAALRAWPRDWWTLRSRLGLTLYSLVLLAAIAALLYGNMLGFRF